MNPRRVAQIRRPLTLCALLLLGQPLSILAEPTPAAASAWSSYIQTVELRLARQHNATNNFVAPAAVGPETTAARLRRGDLIIERLTPSVDTGPAGALLHDWRGTAFAPGATVADFDRLLRDFNSYPRYFAPQVVQASVLTHEGDRMTAFMRVRQKHVLTVVMDTTYDVNFSQLDRKHGYSISRSTHIAEIASPGTASERPLGPNDEHGFLWRLNTYWSYEERDGGLYLQIESVSLTRSVPTGLGWAVRPYVESVPRESLEFTLRSACNALRK